MRHGTLPLLLLLLTLVPASTRQMLARENTTGPAADRAMRATARPRPVPPAIEIAAPRIHDTATNLGQAFANETNACRRYRVYAAQAEGEACLDMAAVFRGLAASESVHAALHAQALARMGRTARAVPAPITTGPCAADLEDAIARETYEIRTWYPAIMARARAEGRTGVLSEMDEALSAERDHLAILKAVRARLDRNPWPEHLYVCGGCGRTVTHAYLAQCPRCGRPANGQLVVR